LQEKDGIIRLGNPGNNFFSSRYRLLTLLLVFLLVGYQNVKPLPEGTSFIGAPHPTDNIAIVIDRTWLDKNNQRHVELAIYDDMLRIIAEANKLIVMDMFLYNDFQGPVAERTRAIAAELTDALINKKSKVPAIDIVVITDPVNELYGGLPSPYFETLRQAGIRVVATHLPALRDSNAVYSFFWRIFVQPFGNVPASTLPNPIGQGRVSIRSYLDLLNFKANHRKVLVADSGDEYVGFVSSANPQDGSSAHRNLAIRFTGAAVADLLRAENAVLALSDQQPVDAQLPLAQVKSNTTVQVVTEGKIRDTILSLIDSTKSDHGIDLMMFYLSERKIIAALKRAHQRGVRLRLLLDPNKDAFGRVKSGVPNRPVGYELNRAGIPVKWCNTQGEQCHAKFIMIHDNAGKSTLVSGSANYTRRNLADFNLEANVVIRGDSDKEVFAAVRDQFDAEWSNAGGRQYSLAFQHYEDRSVWRHWRYRFMEWSGISSF